MADNNSTPPFRIFPAVHGNELSERNERRGRRNFSLLVLKKIRRRGSKKTSDLSTTVTTSTDQDDFENPSHQALQPRPILDALLVSLNFASIKNIFDSVFLLSKPKWAKVSSVTTRFIYIQRLFGKINTFKQQRNHKFLWTANGKILLRLRAKHIDDLIIKLKNRYQLYILGDMNIDFFKI